MSTASPAKPHAQLVDDIATEIMALVERHAPCGGDARLAAAGDEALLAALARRVGPCTYARILAALIPAKRV